MIGERARTAVVYLAWLPYGIQHCRDFIMSYKRHDAGHSHDLFIVFNGSALPHPDPVEDYLALLKAESVEGFRVMYFDRGQDIEIYSHLARELDHDYLLFLNTYSILLAPNWLKHYTSAWEDSIGAIAATGSWQSYFSSVFYLNKFKRERGEGMGTYFRKLKLIVKAQVYWRFLFDAFPNHHIRTNAFFVDRKMFASVTAGCRISSKFDAYLFESGKKGLTRQLERRGKKVVVINRNGHVYAHSDWPAARVFRVGNQEDLLVSDNQTREYEHASVIQRKQLTELAWGNHA